MARGKAKKAKKSKGKRKTRQCAVKAPLDRIATPID